uniref:Reverse transcriptase n=1 Tax=Monascus pilosus TaxID=89488 RepID=Q2PWA8_MONPI|nr:reverse transcriptase [Monascus pilosus]
MKIIQANVGRGGPSHDLLLSFTADIILVQEPWTKMAKHLTKTHPRYQLFSPTTRWEIRPRTLTYVRKDLPAHTLPQPSSPDITAVEVDGLTIINVYRPPNDSVTPSSPTRSTIHTLLQYPVPRNTIIAGDFNTHHPLWQPETQLHALSAGATALVEWLETQGLVLCMEPGTPTRGPNTLDLVFANLPVVATVEDHLSTFSDHKTILAQLKWREPQPQHKLGSTNWEKARELLVPPDADLPTDTLAEELVSRVQLAIQGASEYNTRRLPHTPWWTPELTNLLRQARQHPPDLQPLQKAISKAKANYWKEWIEQATTPTKAFTLAKWQKPSNQLASPPLLVQGNQITTPQGKADAFLTHLLKKGVSLPNQLEEGPPNRPLDPMPLPTKEECWNTLCSPSPSAPGEDSLTTSVWRELWPVIGDAVTALYHQSLEKGLVPQIFKAAKIIMLPKPGKRDLTQLGSWRPISLLSTLGKGLERLIARWMAVQAIQGKLLTPCHFGALPGRSAIDLVQVLVHRVEKAFQQGKVASLLLMDVKGAFDAVDHQRLLSHLRLQGWDERLLQWIQDWLSSRSACVQIGEANAKAPIKGGLPQGSPLSPILFLLYAAMVVAAYKASFCYADDLGILFVGDSLQETSQQLVETYKAVTALGTEVGLPFSAEKTEIQHFSRKRKHPPPVVRLPDVGEIPPTSYTRWLGVLLDIKLTFKPHINWVFSRGKQLAQHLQRLSNTQRGCPVASMRAAVLQCALPTALYGVEVFYTGQQQVANSLQSLLRIAALAILPAYKTTPTAALLREADLPDPRAFLESILQRAAARYAGLDAKHPVARIHAAPNYGYNTRLTRILQRIPTPAPERRWVEPQPPPLRMLPTHREGHISSPLAISVYSDGSHTGQGAGYGYAIYYGSILVTQGQGPAGPRTEVYDAEIMGAVEGLRAAVGLPCTAYANQLNLFLDNLAAASLLADGRPAPHRRHLTDTFHQLSKQWLSLPYILASPRRPVRVSWVPGHTGIAGNELADRLAKQGAAMEGSHIPPSPAYLRREAKQQLHTATQAAYTRSAPQAYQDLGIRPHTKSSRAQEHKLPRWVLGRLIAARTGHGDFAAYHERFHHTDYLATCSCKKLKTPVHFFFCPHTRKRWKERRKHTLAGPAKTIDWLLGTAAGAEEFSRIVQNTSFFTDICPNWAHLNTE